MAEGGTLSNESWSPSKFLNTVGGCSSSDNESGEFRAFEPELPDDLPQRCGAVSSAGSCEDSILDKGTLFSPNENADSLFWFPVDDDSVESLLEGDNIID
ncbi:hypothetical protein OGAPHI_002240 [Ogataea philodendri]|uniref:Uncharacterized protein n=1 Tax=Ogataea philodendri TaxID=1378263 RepID=A0A9P8PB31_9ASCO|nr:uncharacterized protein OGAPHI_002240 [Ogataea philodendri]KAH3668486.1 hypothetical protein OGAPHI_002240 [Ogataea philodendri]